MSVNDATARRAESRIRQYCCLGQPSEVVMPSVLRDLHHLVPSFSNTFYWVDADGGLANAIDEQPDATRLLPEYIACFYNRKETEVHPGFTRITRGAHGVLDNDSFFTVSDATLRNSAFYTRIMKPQRYHYVLQLHVRLAGRTRGILQLQRSAGEPDFVPRDHRTLQRLHDFIAHALVCNATEQAVTEWCEGAESGLLMADACGRIVSASPRARQLLHLATHPIPDGSRRDLELPAMLARVCRSLHAVHHGPAAGNAPLHICRNGWGRFIFSAYPLDFPLHDKALIGIHIRREIPLPVRLVAATEALTLSPRQAEVAVLLASGLTHREIAERLGVRRNTVIAHARQVYTRLDVHDSRGLKQTLLGTPPGDPADRGRAWLH